MSVAILIPARSGSKGIPDKNRKNFAGHPLASYVITSGVLSGYTTYLAVDNQDYVHTFCGYDCNFWFRPDWTATDTASTDETALCFVNAMGLDDNDILVIAQPTSPYTSYKDIQGIVNMVESVYDSALSVYRKHLFIWKECTQRSIKFGIPKNYAPAMRPRRQDWEGQLFENGALYATRVGGLRATSSRLSGCIGLYEMQFGFELDDHFDWIAGERIMEELWTQQR